MMCTTEFKVVTPEQASEIICTRQPLGLFYLLDNGVYVGIDNSTGDAWTEEFSNLRQCEKWLKNPSLSAPSMN